MLCGEEWLECEDCVDGIRLEHVSEFKYLGCVLEESVTDDAEFNKKVASGMRVAGAIWSLVNAGYVGECTGSRSLGRQRKR